MMGLPWRAVQCSPSGAGGSSGASLISLSRPSWVRNLFGPVFAIFARSVGLHHFDFLLVVHAQAAHDHHIFALRYAAQHLHLIALLHASCTARR